jgi:hypothetical protein
MSRELAPEVLYTSEQYDRHHPQSAADVDWGRDKSFTGQWSKMGITGLTQEEYDEGLQMAVGLDQLQHKRNDALFGKTMEELRKKPSS